MKFHTTDTGTKLPIMQLKGKDYMMVAYRIQWFRETHPMGMILTEPVKIDNDSAIFKATIAIPNENGLMVQLASATKKEDVKGFPDFIEKAETGSIGRALALAGFGTQFSIPELDEGDRLADSPLTTVVDTTHIHEKRLPPTAVAPAPIDNSTIQVVSNGDTVTTAVPQRGSFRKPGKPSIAWGK